MTSVASSEQNQVKTQAQKTGQQQEFSGGCQRLEEDRKEQIQGGWNSDMAPFSSQFTAGPKMFGMGQMLPGFRLLPFNQYQIAYNASLNPGLLGQYPWNSK
ncbi:MAG: hypothetical protein EZS28_054971 [Streblomastix strix]|uniref:Uncharacterized protein n=1 Tax=Streblomastix strix TaxID=222440 RepID=A0A5J4QB58_9EUKA|nr:MAG: hypothetical protein EZS28_054971 [Streblomastix strix]